MRTLSEGCHNSITEQDQWPQSRNFSELTFVGHCQVPLATDERINVLVILGGATTLTLLTSEVVERTADVTNILLLRKSFDQYHLQIKCVVVAPPPTQKQPSLPPVPEDDDDEVQEAGASNKKRKKNKDSPREAKPSVPVILRHFRSPQKNQVLHQEAQPDDPAQDEESLEELQEDQGGPDSQRTRRFTDEDSDLVLNEALWTQFTHDQKVCSNTGPLVSTLCNNNFSFFAHARQNNN